MTITLKMKTVLKSLFSLYLLMICLSGNAQSLEKLGSWNTVAMNYKINDKIKIYGEVQLRSFLFYDHFYYYHITTNINYSFRKWFSVSSGLANHNTYPETGNFDTPASLKEFRIFEEIIFKLSYSRFNFENKYKLEERFTTDGFKSRFRPRLGLTIPISRPVLEPKTIYLSLYDELFITDKLEKNRYFAGLGYKMNKISIMSGLQDDNNTISKTDKKYLVIALLFDFGPKIKSNSN
jgi:hypothetical protein